MGSFHHNYASDWTQRASRCMDSLYRQQLQSAAAHTATRRSLDFYGHLFILTVLLENVLPSLPPSNPPRPIIHLRARFLVFFFFYNKNRREPGESSFPASLAPHLLRPSRLVWIQRELRLHDKRYLIVFASLIELWILSPSVGAVDHRERDGVSAG